MKISFLAASAWLMGAAVAQANVYICTFKPGPRDHWMPTTVTITDPGAGPLPTVWDDMIEKEVGRPIIAEAKVTQARRSYAWELGPVDTSALMQGQFYPTGKIFYTLFIRANNQATLSQGTPGYGGLTDNQLFGACSQQP
ncbi:hypothetical protein [Phaeovulum sp. W22_SRMD_FR3]|uniref:hypothetical protein n=1 Tax=Phaeovulum sp. W22_SRMD_FR3 TaxID=3240274 RepID=UPI003F9545CC